MTSVGFAKRNYEMMHETFDAELEVEVTDNTWLTVCADILTDGYICYETWKDLPPEITLEIEPQFRIKYLYDEEGNEYSPNLLTDELKTGSRLAFRMDSEERVCTNERPQSRQPLHRT
jgi:hypothetical protein